MNITFGSNSRFHHSQLARTDTNGPPHIGHAYESVTSDVIARWHRIWGRDVFFLTGTDEHGQKIQATAEENGVKPIDICNKYAEGFKRLNQRLLVSSDRFIRTTDEDHIATCQELWRRCAAKGKAMIQGLCVWPQAAVPVVRQAVAVLARAVYWRRFRR